MGAGDRLCGACQRKRPHTASAQHIPPWANTPQHSPSTTLCRMADMGPLPGIPLPTPRHPFPLQTTLGEPERVSLHSSAPPGLGWGYRTPPQKAYRKTPCLRACLWFSGGVYERTKMAIGSGARHKMPLPPPPPRVPIHDAVRCLRPAAPITRTGDTRQRYQDPPPPPPPPPPLPPPPPPPTRFQ